MSITPTSETRNSSANDPDDLTEEQMAASRAGIRRGLEAGAAGRVKTLARQGVSKRWRQVVAEARQKHGFPSSWASGIDGAHLHPEPPVEQQREAFSPDVLAPAERGNKQL